MLLLAGRYGMHIGGGKSKDKKDIARLDRRLLIPSALAMAFGLIVFALSMQYGSALYAPAVFFGNTTMNGQLTYQNMISSLGYAHANITVLGGSLTGTMFAITQNGTGTYNVTYAVATQLADDYRGGVLANYSSMSNASAYTLRNGVTITDRKSVV